jgi:trimethylamine---corrinoid protein Co-methyltransferase
MIHGNMAIPHLNMLTPEQCETIHLASLEILRRTGVRIFHHEALQLLSETDAVISDENLVRFPPAMIEWACSQAPSRIGLCKRGTDEVVVPLEAMQVNFGSGSDCLNYLDPYTGIHRKFTVNDLIKSVHLIDALPELGFCMSMGIPSDLEATNTYRQQFAFMLENTSKPIVFVCDNLADCEVIIAMAVVAAGGIADLRLNPTLLLYSEPTTPLKHSRTATEKLLFMAEQQIPIVHSPAPMMGGTAPMTLAGGLALGNAEVLSSLVLHQLKHPGAPFVYGQGLHHIDMKTTISVYGAPEYQLARVLVAEMGRYYGLPTWGYAGHSDSCAMDEQAAADAAFSVLIALLTGTNLVHDVGYLEAGLTTSPEMIVFTAEMIGMMRQFTTGITLDSEALALEVIHQVGPGGEYMSNEHTLRHFRDMWMPTLFSRQRMSEWIASGSLHLGQRLQDRTIAIMEAHTPQPLPDKTREEIRYLLNQS